MIYKNKTTQQSIYMCVRKYTNRARVTCPSPKKMFLLLFFSVCDKFDFCWKEYFLVSWPPLFLYFVHLLSYKLNKRFTLLCIYLKIWACFSWKVEADYYGPIFIILFEINWSRMIILWKIILDLIYNYLYYSRASIKYSLCPAEWCAFLEYA